MYFIDLLYIDVKYIYICIYIQSKHVFIDLLYIEDIKYKFIYIYMYLYSIKTFIL